MELFEQGTSCFFNNLVVRDHQPESDQDISLSKSVVVPEEESQFYEAVVESDANQVRTVKQYQNICQAQLSKLEDGLTGVMSKDDCNMLRFERNTWRLLLDLCQKQNEIVEDRENNADAMITQDISTAYGELQKLGLEDMDLRDHKVVLGWLEAIATEDVSYNDTRRSMRRRTIAALSQYGREEKLVQHLDPDAQSRENLPIQYDDAEDEFELLKSVWECVRCGDTEKAIEACINAGQSWRAASLSGGQVCGSRQEENRLIRWGNPNRNLWSAMCWKLSEQATDDGDKMAVYERAIYAALSNNVNRLIESPLCRTWEDHCWVYFKAEVELREDAVAQAHALRRISKTRHTSGPLDSKYVQNVNARSTGYTASSIFEKLASSTKLPIRDSAFETHHLVQAHLVENRVDEIVSTVLWRRICGEDNETTNVDEMWKLHLTKKLPADSLSRHELRFAAHLVLFYMDSTQTFDKGDGYMILKAYIRHLLLNRRVDLIPFYANQLPEEGCVRVYAEVLLHSNEQERRSCMTFAKQFISASTLTAITKRAVEISINTDTQQTTSEHDSRVKAIELLCINPSERAEALVQSNSLVRRFVVNGDERNAIHLMEKVLPRNTLAVIEAEEQTVPSQIVQVAIREYLMWEAYLKSHMHYGLWRECIVQKKDGGKWLFDEERRYLAELGMLFNDVSQSILDVLRFEGGWLIDVDSEYSSVGAKKELLPSVLRQNILPRLVFSLHGVYFDTAMSLLSLEYHDEAEKAFELMSKSLELNILSTSDRFHIFSAFSSQEATRLLELSSKSAMEILRLHGSIDGDCMA